MMRILIDQPDTIIRLRSTLSAGGIAVVPTDTLYGLSAAMSSRRAYDRIVSIKRSGADRRYLYLASDIDMVERYIDDWGCASRRMLQAIWPAPLTAIFRSGDRSPRWVGGTVAFRVPRYAPLQAVIDALGEPIVSTSVNEAGGPPINDLGAIEDRFGHAVDLIVDGGMLPGGLPSTLVDLSGSEPVVLRAGAYGWTAVEKPSK
jgi:L-threonylcarbamoyladenylate synthase